MTCNREDDPACQRCTYKGNSRCDDWPPRILSDLVRECEYYDEDWDRLRKYYSEYSCEEAIEHIQKHSKAWPKILAKRV